MSPIRQDWNAINSARKQQAFKTTKFAHNLFFDGDSKIFIADLRVTRKIWSDDQCRNSRIVGKVGSASVCWDTCKKSTECNAVNYNLDNTECVLRHCANPVPAPEWSFSPWMGISALPSGKNSNYFQNARIMVSKGMVSKSKYWISEKNKGIPVSIFSE